MQNYMINDKVNCLDDMGASVGYIEDGEYSINDGKYERRYLVNLDKGGQALFFESRICHHQGHDFILIKTQQ